MASLHRAHLEHEEYRQSLDPSSRPSLPQEPWRLTYFNLTARGVAIVTALELCGAPYEADMIELKDWAERKPRQPAFAKQLPLMRLPDGRGTVIGQSVAIMNCVAAAGGGRMTGEGPDFAISQMLLQEAEEWYTILYSSAYKPLVAASDWNAEKSAALWDESSGGWFKFRARLSMVIPLLAERLRQKKEEEEGSGAEQRQQSASSSSPSSSSSAGSAGLGGGVGVDRFTASGVTIGELNLFAMLYQAMAGPFPGAADFTPSLLDQPETATATGGGGNARSLRPFYDRMMALPAVRRVLSGETAAGRLLTFFGPDPLKPALKP